MRNIVIGEPVVAVPSLRIDGDESRFRQFRKMCAHGLLGHAGNVGKLCRGQGLSCHQCRQGFCTRVVADERCNADDVWAVFHGSMLDEPSRGYKALSFGLEQGEQR